MLLIAHDLIFLILAPAMIYATASYSGFMPVHLVIGAMTVLGLMLRGLDLAGKLQHRARESKANG